jgi:hypothetical protein
MNNICALNKDQTTCLPDKSIKLIASNYLNNIKKLDTKLIINKLSEQNESCKNLDNLQEKELCILENIKKDNNTNSNINKLVHTYELTYFKPITNKLDSNYWINNTEIDNIQHQLLMNFPNYYYSYIHMFDLKMFKPQTSNIFKEDKVIKPLTEIDFVDELKNKTTFNFNKELKYFGTVFNTDISSGSGIHWFCIFIDFTLNPIQIEYFNSSGYDIKNDVYGNKFHRFFINLADEISLNYKPCKFIKVSDIEHQRSDTANCGSYSLFYIWERLNNRPYDYFANNKILDEDMEKFRSFLWRKK